MRENEGGLCFICGPTTNIPDTGIIEMTFRHQIFSLSLEGVKKMN